MNIFEVQNNFVEDSIVSVSGRVVQIRTFGKLSFLKIQDTLGQIQIGLRSKNIPSYWDIISVTGKNGFSQKGEKTIWTEDFVLVSKCEGNVPEKYHGLSDKEKIYKQRYLDLISNQDSKNIFLQRSQMISKIRTFLNDRNYLEIETPIISYVPSGASAEPFKTLHNALNKDMYLRIATEIPLKKALIGGFERVYEIGKIFRNEGIDKTHNPEFTSIELYQSYTNLDDMKKLFLDLLIACGSEIIMDIPVYEYDDLVSKYGEEFDQHLQDLCFVVGQPIEQTPLCKMRVDGKADRFEVFANGYEIANAYNEINDWKEQQKRFNGAEDDGLVEAMKYGMPPTGGMGIGIDRLLMYLTKTSFIRDVIMFPTSAK